MSFVDRQKQGKEDKANNKLIHISAGYSIYVLRTKFPICKA